MDAELLDRAAGVLVGLATGDALGAGYEFGAPPLGNADMIGGGLGGWDPGEWTDDTQLAICVAEEVATGSLDPVAVGNRLLGWFHDGPADVGIQTRAVLRAAKGGSELRGVSRAYLEQHPENAAGNGSLMRTAPVALAQLGDDGAILAAAAEISSLTHADPLAVEACQLWCIAVDRAVREQRLDGVREGLELIVPSSRTRWAGWIADAEEGPPANFNPNGFVVRALQAAWSAVVHTPEPGDDPSGHLRNALQTAVRIGDDTDTVAAIALAARRALGGNSCAPRMARDAARLARVHVQGPRSVGRGFRPRRLSQEARVPPPPHTGDMTESNEAHPVNPAHIWFLLDRSASMEVLLQDVVLGLQEFIREQRLADPRARLTLVQFDSEDPQEVILDGKRLEKIDEVRATKRFEPRGATPLYDAIAALIGRADKQVADGGDDADQLVVIFTDGMENASTDCDRAKAFQLIKERRDRGWTFAFLGANQDAFEAGGQIGVAPQSTKGWDATRMGTRAALSTLSQKSAEQLKRTRSQRREKRDDFFEDA